ncbi:MAG: methyltransferase, TIGR04325 family [Chloroflexota bacterium]
MQKVWRLKQVIKLFLPPLFISVGKFIINGFTGLTSSEWEYVPEQWARAKRDPKIKGWNVQAVLDAYINKWPAFVESLNSTYPLGLSPEADPSQKLDLSSHNISMTYGYTLALAAQHKTQIQMLDWGGGIGHYYLIGQKLLPNVQIDYHCKDLPLLAEYGQKLFPEAHFYVDDSWRNRQYDFVLASSSLQYSEDWKKSFAQLAECTADYLFVTRLPVVHHVPSYVMVQRPYQYGYDTEYLGWCINRTEIIDYSRTLGLELVREFVIEYPPVIQGAPEQCDYWGFLFRKPNLADEIKPPIV